MALTGLSRDEATKRLAEFGPNAFDRRSQVIWWRILLSQFKSPLVYILVLAAGITIWLGEYTDAVVIGIAVLVNTFFGFVQEYRAGRALEALTNLLVPKAKIKRDGQWQEIELRHVVPGDIARLELGQSIPADGVLVENKGLVVNEAILTGESVPVDKQTLSLVGTVRADESWWQSLKPENQVFQGTTVAGGLGEMLVIRTGTRTRLGSIARQVAGTMDEATPLQRKIQHLGRQLTLFLAVVAFFVFVIGLLAGDPLAEILPTAIALAVAAIPEGLLVGLTLILSIGMGRILKQRGLVRKLLAAEVLGGVDVICLDKTGTITEGRMKTLGAVTQLATAGGAEPKSKSVHDQKQLELLFLGAKLCNDLHDPLELAMDEWASVKGKIDSRAYERLDSLPFDHRYKYIVTRNRHKESGKTVEFLSGAPEVCLELSTLTSTEKRAWQDAMVSTGKAGYRIVGFGYRVPKLKVGQLSHERLGKFHWLGLVVFEDPIRVGVETSLHQARQAGISLKVITGDFVETAWSVLTKLGLAEGPVDPDKVVTGSELDEFLRAADKRGISQHIEKAILFARVNPDQKLIIVKAIQDHGHVVAMTGDGVNDAPAVRQADIGIVLSEGSDVAKETSDMVLLDNNFATILAAVEEGRAIFANLRRVLLYLMADAFAAIILVLISLAWGWPLPLVAVQILWINLLSDSFPNLALTIEPKDKKLLQQPPTPKNAPLIDQHMLVLIAVISGTAGILSAVLFFYFDQVLGTDLGYTRSAVFAGLGSMTLAYVYSVRAFSAGIWQINPLKNPWLILATVMGLVIQLAALYWPPLMMLLRMESLELEHWLVIIGAVIALVAIVESIKALLRKIESVNQNSALSNQIS